MTETEDKPKKKRTYKRKYTRKPAVAVVDEAPIIDRDGMEAIVEPEVAPAPDGETEDLEAVVMGDILINDPEKRETAPAITMSKVAPPMFNVPAKEKKTRKVWGDGAILMSSRRRQGSR